MPNDLTKKYFDASWPFEVYKFTSFISSLFLWLGLFYFENNFFSKAHFITLLLVGNFFIYTKTNRITFYLIEQNLSLYYFSFQLMCLIGVSYAHQSNDFLYLALLPILMAAYHSTVIRDDLDISRDLSVYMYSLIFCSLLIVEGYNKGNIYTAFEAISLFTFLIWTFATLVITLDIYQNDKKSLLKRLLKKSKHHEIAPNKTDRMFFHDFVNHTHSLLLFLRSKQGSQNFKDEDIQSIIHEVKLMQDTIHQHYGFSHKNINGLQQQVPFHMAMARVYHLIDSFFSSNQNVDIKFFGKIQDFNDFDTIRDCTVDFVAFHRIMTNILKNAYEASSDSVECVFDYREDGLHFKVLNSLNKFNQNKVSLDRELGVYILNTDKRSSDHLGLESIEKLCEDVGGSFNFKVQDGKWISECYLPKERESKSKKAA